MEYYGAVSRCAKMPLVGYKKYNVLDQLMCL